MVSPASKAVSLDTDEANEGTLVLPPSVLNHDKIKKTPLKLFKSIFQRKGFKKSKIKTKKKDLSMSKHLEGSGKSSKISQFLRSFRNGYRKLRESPLPVLKRLSSVREERNKNKSVDNRRYEKETEIQSNKNENEKKKSLTAKVADASARSRRASMATSSVTAEGVNMESDMSLLFSFLDCYDIAKNQSGTLTTLTPGGEMRPINRYPNADLETDFSNKHGHISTTAINTDSSDSYYQHLDHGEFVQTENSDETETNALRNATNLRTNGRTATENMKQNFKTCEFIANENEISYHTWDCNPWSEKGDTGMANLCLSNHADIGNTDYTTTPTLSVGELRSVSSETSSCHDTGPNTMNDSVFVNDSYFEDDYWLCHRDCTDDDDDVFLASGSFTPNNTKPVNSKVGSVRMGVSSLAAIHQGHWRIDTPTPTRRGIVNRSAATRLDASCKAGLSNDTPVTSRPSGVRKTADTLRWVPLRRTVCSHGDGAVKHGNVNKLLSSKKALDESTSSRCIPTKTSSVRADPEGASTGALSALKYSSHDKTYHNEPVESLEATLPIFPLDDSIISAVLETIFDGGSIFGQDCATVSELNEKSTCNPNSTQSSYVGEGAEQLDISVCSEKAYGSRSNSFDSYTDRDPDASNGEWTGEEILSLSPFSPCNSLTFTFDIGLDTSVSSFDKSCSENIHYGVVIGEENTSVNSETGNHCVQNDHDSLSHASTPWLTQPEKNVDLKSNKGCYSFEPIKYFDESDSHGVQFDDNSASFMPEVSGPDAGDNPSPHDNNYGGSNLSNVYHETGYVIEGSQTNRKNLGPIFKHDDHRGSCNGFVTSSSYVLESSNTSEFSCLSPEALCLEDGCISKDDEPLSETVGKEVQNKGSTVIMRIRRIDSGYASAEPTSPQ